MAGELDKEEDIVVVVEVTAEENETPEEAGLVYITLKWPEVAALGTIVVANTAP